jgi:hypothetical protein
MNKTNSGQALVEYVLVLLFSVIILVKIINAFANFMADSVGNLGHVIGINLKVGVCQSRCFYDGYKNGKQ